MSITWATSLTTMHAARSSVYLGSKAKPSLPKNSLGADGEVHEDHAAGYGEAHSGSSAEPYVGLPAGR